VLLVEVGISLKMLTNPEAFFKVILGLLLFRLLLVFILIVIIILFLFIQNFVYWSQVKAFVHHQNQCELDDKVLLVSHYCLHFFDVAFHGDCAGLLEYLIPNSTIVLKHTLNLYWSPVTLGILFFLL